METGIFFSLSDHGVEGGGHEGIKEERNGIDEGDRTALVGRPLTLQSGLPHIRTRGGRKTEHVGGASFVSHLCSLSFHPALSALEEVGGGGQLGCPLSFTRSYLERCSS